MKTNLPFAINTIDEAHRFLTELHQNKEVFHPEDNAHEIVWETCNPPSFDECDRLNKLMQDICMLPNFDPCDYLTVLDEEAKALGKVN